MIVAKPHQVKKANECWNILKKLGYVYLAGKPRSGKTYTAILTAEKSTKISNVLVLTPKKAIDGWNKFIIGNSELNHTYYVTNYEQAGKVERREKGNKVTYTIKLKLSAKNYNLVIIDESHNLGVVGAPTGRYKVINALCKNMPHIHLSGTAIVESPCGIYHQMAISKFTPFKHSSFYDFHREFGKPYVKFINGNPIKQYDKAKEDILLPLIDKFTVYMTQEDAGISKDVQAIDVKHYVELSEDTKYKYNFLTDYGLLELPDGSEMIADTKMKERISLHMLESGIAKIDDEYIFLGNTEKIYYIKETFGDTQGVGIMSHFVGERMLLEKEFKYAQIYSSTADAEGVDLSHLRAFVIISSGYSGAKFIQRKERIINMEGSNSLEVHHILVKGAISEQVFNKTSKKEDFNNKTYERNKL